MTINSHDAARIHQLGGPTKVCALIGLNKYGGAQRVQNWLKRGIPAAIKVKHPDLFMPHATPPQNPAVNPAAHP